MAWFWVFGPKHPHPLALAPSNSCPNHCTYHINHSPQIPSIGPCSWFQQHIQNWASAAQLQFFSPNPHTPLTISNSCIHYHHHHFSPHSPPTPSMPPCSCFQWLTQNWAALAWFWTFGQIPATPTCASEHSPPTTTETPYALPHHYLSPFPLVQWKPSPSSLVLDFWPQNLTPLAQSYTHPHHPTTTSFPALHKPPSLPLTAVSSGTLKTEPWQLGFAFLIQIPLLCLHFWMIT